MSKYVAIIGGGLAGLAAATKLSQAGIQTTIFETSTQLGGRARGVKVSSLDLDHDIELDNGQHLMIGAYRATLGLLASVGVNIDQHFLRLPLNLNVFDLNHVHTAYQKHLSLNTANILPAPLHLLYGLLCAQGLSWPERWLALRWMSQLKLSGYRLKNDLSVVALLQLGKQSQRLIDLLWEPLCLAALNTPTSIASAQVFLNVLRDSFNQDRQDADFLLAKHDLSTSLCTPLADYIVTHGGAILTQTRITNLSIMEQGIKTSACDKLFSHAILAVGPHQLKHLSLSQADLTHQIEIDFNYQAITTVYLQFAPHIQLPKLMQGYCHGLAQWVFDRGQICGQPGLLAVVISAHRANLAGDENDKDALALRLINEINLSLPPEAQLPTQPLWFKVITEKKATFSCEADKQRPSMHTQHRHVLLAGDYVAGDYPATIEGAVRSGLASANHIIQNQHD